MSERIQTGFEAKGPDVRSGCWQTNANSSQLGQGTFPLCCAEISPFGESGDAVQLEDLLAGEAAFLVEGRGVDGSELP